jgi:hypothetical protein
MKANNNLHNSQVVHPRRRHNQTGVRLSLFHRQCRAKKQFRYKMGINYLRTKKERVLEANAIIEALLIKLQDGWNLL